MLTAALISLALFTNPTSPIIPASTMANESPFRYERETAIFDRAIFFYQLEESAFVYLDFESKHTRRSQEETGTYFKENYRKLACRSLNTAEAIGQLARQVVYPNERSFRPTDSLLQARRDLNVMEDSIRTRYQGFSSCKPLDADASIHPAGLLHNTLLLTAKLQGEAFDAYTLAIVAESFNRRVSEAWSVRTCTTLEKAYALNAVSHAYASINNLPLYDVNILKTMILADIEAYQCSPLTI